MTHKYSSRIITAKYAGKCHCCGGTIKRGEVVDYFPALRAVAHRGGLDGNSATCTAVIRDKADFIDVDRMYEDSCADICGR